MNSDRRLARWGAAVLATAVGCQALLADEVAADPAAEETATPEGGLLSDAVASEGSPPADGAGADGGARPDATGDDASVPPQGCDSFRDATLCDDFDDDASISTARWRLEGTTGALVGPPASRIAPVDGGVSAPNAVQLSVPRVASDAGLFVTKLVAKVPLYALSLVRVHARLRLPSAQGTYVKLLAVELGSPYRVVSLDAFQDGLHVLVADQNGNLADWPAKADLSTFRSVDLRVQLGSSPRVTLLVDGAVAVGDAGVPIGGGSLQGALDVSAGIFLTDSAFGSVAGAAHDAGTLVLLDDLVVWTE